jgi:hypothetical protein
MMKPKYRILALDELHELEKEFIEFLVINGVQPDDWANLQGTAEADRMIVAFSDVIFESIMRRTTYLELWDSQSIKTFHCLSEKMILVGADLKDGAKLNLLEATTLDLMTNFQSLAFYQTEKHYAGAREAVIFDMINSGCKISDGKLFKKMLMAMVD